MALFERLNMKKSYCHRCLYIAEQQDDRDPDGGSEETRRPEKQVLALLTAFISWLANICFITNKKQINDEMAYLKKEESLNCLAAS